MVKSVTNDNIKKLRELTDKLCDPKSDEYKIVLKNLKDIVDKGKSVIDSSSSAQSKIKCYETMCTKITDLLSNVKI